jgi:hypothetical protein
MATIEERMKILKMIQEGKITADQGVQLLQALEEGAQAPASRKPAPAAGPSAPHRHVAPAGQNARWFRVQVTDINTGKARVNVRLPVGLVSAGMKMGARFAPQVEGLDPDQIMAFLNSGETGQIVDVLNEQDGEHVQVFIE